MCEGLAAKGHEWLLGAEMAECSLADVLLKAFLRTVPASACSAFVLVRYGVHEGGLDPSHLTVEVDGARTATALERERSRKGLAQHAADAADERGPQQRQLEECISKYKFTVCTDYVR